MSPRDRVGSWLQTLLRAIVHALLIYWRGLWLCYPDVLPNVVLLHLFFNMFRPKMCRARPFGWLDTTLRDQGIFQMMNMTKESNLMKHFLCVWSLPPSQKNMGTRYPWGSIAKYVYIYTYIIYTIVVPTIHHCCTYYIYHIPRCILRTPTWPRFHQGPMPIPPPLDRPEARLQGFGKVKSTHQKSNIDTKNCHV